jgi:hypothetical protein
LYSPSAPTGLCKPAQRAGYHYQHSCQYISWMDGWLELNRGNCIAEGSIKAGRRYRVFVDLWVQFTWFHYDMCRRVCVYVCVNMCMYVCVYIVHDPEIHNLLSQTAAIRCTFLIPSSLWKSVHQTSPADPIYTYEVLCLLLIFAVVYCVNVSW